MKDSKLRSPLKGKALRRAGQSLLEERERLIDDKLEPWGLMAIFLFVFAGLEWYRYVFPFPASPWFFTAAAVVAIGFLVWRYVRYLPQLENLRLGIEGERVVGEYLERLREKGFRVFHDVMAEGFNLDHVLVGPTGVYTVETKTRSKPVRGEARVTYDGQVLLVAGFEPERDAIAQAKGQARWLSALIAETTERKVFVQPVVVFPGWYVEAAEGSQSNVWVMEPKGLPAFISKQRECMTKEDIALLSKCISMHVRAHEREHDRKGPFV